jgi:hypothetical protein
MVARNAFEKTMLKVSVSDQVVDFQSKGKGIIVLFNMMR